MGNALGEEAAPLAGTPSGEPRADRHAPPIGLASFPEPIPENRYQSLLYGSLAPFGIVLVRGARFDLGWLVRNRNTVQVLHFHWPQPYYRVGGARTAASRALSWPKAALFVFRLCAARLLGYRVVWTVHQVVPHDRPGRVDRLAAAALARSCRLLIAHDEPTARRVRALSPRAGDRLLVVPHGSYVGVYPAGRSRTAVRDELGIPRDAFVFLCFGNIRRYKGVETLLRAFTRLERDDVALLVAGAPLDEGPAEAVRRAAEQDPRIVAIPEFVPDDRVRELFDASDAAVVTRPDGGTSGALVLALSNGLPVVAPRCPAYEALLCSTDAGWLFDAADEASLAAALDEAAAAVDVRNAKAAAASARAKELSWPRIGARIAAAVREIAGPDADRDRVDVLLVCSTGGHLVQLAALRDTWDGYSTAWVTFDKSDSRTILRDERVVFAHGPTNRSLTNLVRNLLLAWKLMSRLRPGVVVTTGAGVGVPFVWVGRLRGALTVYIESFTRIQRPSLSCRLVLPVAHRIFVQWPDLERVLPRARFAGTVFDDG